MKTSIITALAGIVALSACGEGVQYAAETYRDVPLAEFSDTTDTWRIFDRPDLSRMMVTPSVGAALIDGAALNTTAPSEAQALAAAQGYLASAAPECRVISVRVVATTLYEAAYTCG